MLGTADVLGTGDLLGTADVLVLGTADALVLGTADVERRTKCPSFAVLQPSQKNGQMATRALPLAKTPPGPFGRPPHQPGPLLATAVCVGPVSGGGAVAGTLHAGTWHSQSASPARQPGTRPGPPAGVQAGRGSLTPVPLGHYLRPSERHPPEEAPEIP